VLVAVMLAPPCAFASALTAPRTVALLSCAAAGSAVVMSAAAASARRV